MVLTNLELETVCGVSSELPQHDIIEIAFWGRSNVGKSSLLNRLWNRKSMARISSEPGKTRTINYYRVEGRPEFSDDLDEAASPEEREEVTGQHEENLNRISCYMVDLPGYGYAKTSREMTAKWKKMIENYLDNSNALRVVFQLIDSRHEPTKNDIEIYNLLFNKGFNPLIIATKTDKLKKNQVLTSKKAIKSGLSLDDSVPIISFSAKDGTGRDEIWEYIEMFVNEIEI